MCVFWQVMAIMMSAGGSRSGCAVAGMVAAEKEAGERVDDFEQERVHSGLLVSGVLGSPKAAVLSEIAEDAGQPAHSLIMHVQANLRTKHADDQTGHNRSRTGHK